MTKSKHILVTGGAGYVGSSLVELLLAKGYEVTVLDRLLFGGDAIIHFFRNKNFHFIKGDIRDKATVKEAVSKVDSIVHLAGIVGFPACDLNSKLAKETNVDATKHFASLLSKDQHIVFGSSGSNYGRVINEVCNEETPLKPITLYSKTKTEAEKILMAKTTCTAYRPGTAFGLSPRLRMDLLMHQLVYQALTQKKIILYESTAMRPFIHVKDAARAFMHALENAGKMKNEVYNLGADSLNFSKKQIAEIIGKETGAVIVEDDSWQDPDKRSYQVSYKKLADTGFKPTITMQEGVREVIRVLPALNLNAHYSDAIEFL